MAIKYLDSKRIRGESGLTSITSEVTDYIRVADNAVKFTVTRGSNHTGYQDTSLTSSSANWVLLLKFKVDIRTETGNDSGYFVFSSSTTNQDGETGNTSGNSIGLGFNNRTSGESAAHGKIQVQAGNSSGYNLAIDANSLQFSDGTTSHTKWFKIIKNGDTVNLTIHDSEADAFSSTLTSGSDTATFTDSTAGAFTNLRYLKWYNETTGSATGSNNYYSGIKLYDNVTSISSSDTPTKKYIFVDDKATLINSSNESFTASSTGQTWTQTGSSIAISGTTITATNALDNASNPTERVTAPLGITLSDDDWVIDFEFSYTGSANNMFPLLVSNTADKILANSMDWVSLGGASTTTMKIAVANAGSGNSGSYSSGSITTSTGTTYYCRMIRSDDDFTLKMYSTEALRTAGGTPDTGTVTQSTPTGITGLAYIQSSGRGDGGGGSNSWVVDNVKIYNGVAVAGVISSAYSNLPENTLFEETDTYKTWWLQNSIWRPSTITRGCWAGGYADSYSNVIDYVNFATIGTCTDFGNLSSARAGCAGCSGSGRGVIGGGDGGSRVDTIDYITVLTTSATATDYGDLQTAKNELGACSDDTRGVWAGGSTGSKTNEMDFLTILTGGEAEDFGNLTSARSGVAGTSNGTTGIFVGGNNGSTRVTTIDFITIQTPSATAGSWGNLTVARDMLGACSDATRGVFAGGEGSSLDTIDYIDYATVGTCTDFGNLRSAQEQLAGCASDTRGCFGGGRISGTNTTDIDYVTIQTPSATATEFGDLTEARRGIASGVQG